MAPTLQSIDGVWHRAARRGDALRVVVVGAMHGDEADGAELVEALADPGHPLWDRADDVDATLVIGNPKALALGSRGTEADADLNRMFGASPPEDSEGYESRRFRELMDLISGVDRLLDLHQTHCDSPALAVVADTSEHLAFVSRLGLEVAVVGTDRVYGARMIADQVNRAGGLGITVETGRAGTQASRAAAQAVLARFLTLEQSSAEEALPVRVFSLEEVVPCPGPGLRFLRPLGNTSRLAEGERWAVWEGGELIAPRDVAVFLPHDDVPPGRPCALFARDRGLHVNGVPSR